MKFNPIYAGGETSPPSPPEPSPPYDGTGDSEKGPSRPVGT